jgi:hypothetical protein
MLVAGAADSFAACPKSKLELYWPLNDGDIKDVSGPLGSPLVLADALTDHEPGARASCPLCALTPVSRAGIAQSGRGRPRSAIRFMGSTVRGLRPVCDGSNWPRWRRAWQTARHMFRGKQRPVSHWCGLLARWEAWFLRFGDVDLGDGADSLWLASIPFRRLFLNSPEGRPGTWLTRNHSVHP